MSIAQPGTLSPLAELGPSRPLAYDLTRLFLGPLFLTPRGIDRVDLALARNVFADPNGPNLGILPTPWGVRAYDAGLVRRFLGQIERLWAEQSEGAQDQRLARLIDQIRRPTAPRENMPGQDVLSTFARAARVVAVLRVTGLPLGRPAARAVPQGAVYLNVGQLGLAVPLFHQWLARRADLTRAIMLHDVIPLTHPELVSPASAGHHARMVRTTARHASCLIFNSAGARDDVNAALARHGIAGLPSLVRALPLPLAFSRVTESVPQLAGMSYFVTVSTIEPRKNHALLLRIWTRLIARMGDEAPHLVIVGSRGYDAARILAGVEQPSQLSSRVHVVSGLSSGALAAFLLGATGALCPSWAEGFGLPVLEANAMGVPTIASDIAAHREVADAASVLLPADDDAGWERAILALPPVERRERPAIPPDLTEAAYCRDLLDFLEIVA